MGKRLVEVRNTSIEKGENGIHIETDGCIVNIRPALYRDSETKGLPFEKVTAIEVIPDNYANEKFVWGLMDDEGTFHPGTHAITRVIRRQR